MVTVYLFNAMEQLRKPLVSGVSELIHKEVAGTLSARIPAAARAAPGEYLGFTCVDGRFRLFVIDSAEEDDSTGETIITATDAAKAELYDHVTVSVQGESLTAPQAVSQMIAGTGFALGATVAGRTTKASVYYQSTWTTLEAAADDHDVRIIPYYVLENSRITAKRIDIEAKEGRYRGRIIEAADGASNITIIKSGRPMARVYATGAATGTGDPPERVTIAGATWSKAAGNPADKPSGQIYVENTAVSGTVRRAYTFADDSEESPQRLLEKAWADLVKRSAPEVSGTATAQDLEPMPGMSHKAVRPFDLVAIKTRAGDAATATVIEISRDYVRPDLTKFTFGKETTAKERAKKSLRAQVQSAAASAARAGGRGSAAMNNSIINAAVIQMNAEHIQANARSILFQAEEIEMRATYEDLDGLKNDVGIELDAIDGKFVAYAKHTDLNDLETEVSIVLDAKANTAYVNAQITEVKTLIAESIEAELAEIEVSLASAIVTEYLNVKTDTFVNNLRVDGKVVNHTPITIVTNYTPALGEAAPTKEITLLTVA